MQGKTLEQLAEHVGGKVVGDGSVEISAVSTLDQAGPGDISFMTNMKYIGRARTTKAGAVIAGSEIETDAALLVADDPYYALMQIVVQLHGHR
ncbi:MAG: UDP-3-O-(3-hydroxymyristoyl)glucosamine N-acyltransferase, partial [Planctomycetes bacterium]|nr:UDP-3-O-(3-hydroxymyristoyl)glucosamine N-acyltransferase [Planctomycetota bacterium]